VEGLSIRSTTDLLNYISAEVFYRTTRLSRRGIIAMSMNYKIYVFDYDAFQAELSDILYRALDEDELDELITFIDTNISRLKDPDGSDPLVDDWRKVFKPRTVQDFSDIAITAYYAGWDETDFGSNFWIDIDDFLREIQDDLGDLILGHPFGPSHNYFNPAKLGAYFQSPAEVKRTLSLVEMLVSGKKDELAEHVEFKEFFDGIIAALAKAVDCGMGVYITF
jgi:hypothetical protein